MVKILVTGATGFIGKRLVYHLLEEGHHVIALVRVKGADFKVKYPERFSMIYGDIRAPDKLEAFPTDIDAVYYLVHSMGSLVQNLVETEVDIAEKFVQLIEKNIS